MDICPLCGSNRPALLHASIDTNRRQFLHCPACDLVFVPKKWHLSPDDEKNRYKSHNNDPEDQGYLSFLGRLFHVMKPVVIPDGKGLDYGSGPGPTLSFMFEEAGHQMDIYDPFFHDDRTVFNKEYDFITCTEVVEHFHNPAIEFEKLDSLLKNTGWIGIMTQMIPQWSHFRYWYYRRDPTHVAFYSHETMTWIAKKYSWSVVFPNLNVALFKKGLV